VLRWSDGRGPLSQTFVFWLFITSAGLAGVALLLKLLTTALGPSLGVATLLATAVVAVINVETEAEWDEIVRQQDAESDGKLKQKLQKAARKFVASRTPRKEAASLDSQAEAPPPRFVELPTLEEERLMRREALHGQLEEERLEMRQALRGRLERLLAGEDSEDQDTDVDHEPARSSDDPAMGTHIDQNTGSAMEESNGSKQREVDIRRRHRAEQVEPD